MRSGPKLDFLILPRRKSFVENKRRSVIQDSGFDLMSTLMSVENNFIFFLFQNSRALS